MQSGTQFQQLHRPGAVPHGFLQTQAVTMKAQARMNAGSNAKPTINTGRQLLFFQNRATLKQKSMTALTSLQIQAGTAFPITSRPGTERNGFRKKPGQLTMKLPAQPSADSNVTKITPGKTRNAKLTQKP